MCIYKDVIEIGINVATAAGTIGATLCALKILPFKSHSMSGVYWIENTPRGTRINIKLTNRSKHLNNVFVPKNGVLVVTKDNSQYLTLNADKDDYLVVKGTSRSLSLKTPRNAEAMRFLKAHPEAELYVFTIDNQRVKLEKKDTECQKKKKQ